VDLRAHTFIVIDPLEPNIEQFDTKHSNLLGSLGEDLLLDQFASLLGRHQRPHIELASRVVREDIAQRHTILRGADDLDQLMLGDGISGLTAQNVIQAGLSTAFVVESQKVLERIYNPPAGEEVDRDVELVLGWHIGRITVPLENSLVDKVDVLDEGALGL